LTWAEADSGELMGDRELSSADFQALYERLRRQAQWGRDDRRGALNQVTPDRLLAAASEVRLGRSVTMAAALAGSAADLAAAQQAQQVDVGPCDLLFATGLYLLDYLQFEDLLPVCETAGRWSFLCVIAPLRLPGGTGSPVNPIAIL
jgi:hypothetical protein